MERASPELRYTALLLAAVSDRRQRELLRLRPRAERPRLKHLIRDVQALCGGDPTTLEIVIKRIGALCWPVAAQRAWAVQQDPLWLRLLVHQNHPVALALVEFDGAAMVAPPLDGPLPAGLAEAVNALSTSGRFTPPTEGDPCA